MKARADSIDALLAEFDESMSRSRAIFSGETNQETANGKVASQWTTALAKATARNEAECPICLNAMSAKAVTLLSCSHVLHAECLVAFESFNIYEVHLCPVCRGHYESRRLHCDMSSFAD
ncbi:hypothetical protein SPRG_15617 [Saprolegnia parasitica CBS 223.65]|nr:hypothetical protein SPRG_15617 [Saprolegnia parasitica CBS 223.65]KDO16491.1 hypothetical protein SPRG_15617 [Saprolegnia parasitica CBS 223.65]|eukprot:XP_012212799.1 hypothetical protein SPRG_15617 [Saprolegnia parasitica CBS 223.65]